MNKLSKGTLALRYFLKGEYWKPNLTEVSKASGISVSTLHDAFKVFKNHIRVSVVYDEIPRKK